MWGRACQACLGSCCGLAQDLRCAVIVHGWSGGGQVPAALNPETLNPEPRSLDTRLLSSQLADVAAVAWGQLIYLFGAFLLELSTGLQHSKG